MDLFSPAGISAWQSRLNRSPDFQEAARTWSGRLLLVEANGGAEDRHTWVVVANGSCQEARVGTAADSDAAEFVLSAAPETWTDLASARLTPIAAALLGRLHLVKGDVFALVPHAKAAAELLAAAADEPPR